MVVGVYVAPALATSEAITSFAFMLDDVPDPVWKTSIGKASSCLPSETSPAAAMIASAVSRGSTSRSRLARAADAFTWPIAWIRAGSIGVPEMGKFSTARWVCARHSASAGTRTSPMESCSMRKLMSSISGSTFDQ